MIRAGLVQLAYVFSAQLVDLCVACVSLLRYLCVACVSLLRWSLGLDQLSLSLFLGCCFVCSGAQMKPRILILPQVHRSPSLPQSPSPVCIFLFPAPLLH
jgi:hypothetical protein